MNSILGVFKELEIWTYGILGIIGLLSLIKFINAWNEMRQAAFGLELESGQQRLNSAATTIVFVIILALAQFFMVTFIIPNVSDDSSLPTPTLNILTTPTSTIESPTENIEEIMVTKETSEQILSTTPSSSDNGCISGSIDITSPVNGSSITGIEPIIGSADIPNFGFYKFEFSSPGQPNWLAIQAWTTPKKNDTLGQWDTSRLAEGLYLLRLVVTDSQGKAFTPCVIQVTILQPPE